MYFRMDYEFRLTGGLQPKQCGCPTQRAVNGTWVHVHVLQSDRRVRRTSRHSGRGDHGEYAMQVQLVHRMRHGGLGRSARDGLTQDRGDPDRGRASTGRGEMPTVVFLNSFARFRDAVMDAITAADWVGVTCEVLILNTIAGLSDPLRRAGCKS